MNNFTSDIKEKQRDNELTLKEVKQEHQNVIEGLMGRLHAFIIKNNNELLFNYTIIGRYDSGRLTLQISTFSIGCRKRESLL